MASHSQVTKRRRTRRQKNAGHARKVKLARKSTASYSELFADLGEPGQPAPAKPATDANN